MSQATRASWPVPRTRLTAITPLSLAFALGLSGTAQAQVDGAETACPTPEAGQLLCGDAPAEDMELASDGAHLFLGTTPGLSGVHQSRLRVMAIDSAKVAELAIDVAREPGWGAAGCAAPAQAPGAHGIHLSRRADGREQLLVVNHEGRESIEFFEPRQTEQGWRMLWRGCVENSTGGVFNDVVGTRDGGFVATVMFEHAAMGADPRLERMLDGRDTGYLMRWLPGGVLERLPRSETAFPNGIQLEPDGQGVWVAAWTGRQLRRYDLARQDYRRSVTLPFMPDNLSWSADGQLLAAGIPDAGTFRACFLGKDEFCRVATRVAALDPQQGDVKLIYSAPDAVLFGASVAVQVGADLYVGAFSGDRLLRLPAFFDTDQTAGRVQQSAFHEE
ncbi:SMP-30/gluconolactonase/LRE family protein [Metapseudomonas resinovorans]|uniref:SMP-30/Gluconolactonase/LRE-like region domain-containing protein n=1 Tax=Metapseudomonas resinovorans NBRC 106553 TaxID=1245471 RepID=S6BIT1_METRE|nr:SMP-30/gluconolactonase/LRE family protein [Pseudomonas resinovorans]BAN49104.1 hypothetical protein PCA10_33720 [Pseudomonas resinovorans NBRC 106553]